MSTIYLREMAAAGFCGSYESGDEAKIGYVHRVLDEILSTNIKPEDFQQEHEVAKAAADWNVHYNHRPFFEKCLRALSRFKESIPLHDYLTFHEDAHPAASDTVYIKLPVTADGLIVEPVYDFYMSSVRIPLVAMIATLIRHPSRATQRIAQVPVLAEEPWKNAIINDYNIDKHALQTLYSQYRVSGPKKPGSQCLSCKVADCKMNEEFAEKVHLWLIKKKEFEGAEQALRQHLTIHGPTKAGQYLVYMKEHNRRYPRSKNNNALVDELIQKAPQGEYMKYFKPDAAAIAKGIKNGVLPDSFKSFFKDSNYFSIESTITI